MKNWIILILGVALIISFFFGQKNRIDYKKKTKSKHYIKVMIVLKKIMIV